MKKILTYVVAIAMCFSLVGQTTYASIDSLTEITDTSKVEEVVFNYFDMSLKSIMNKDIKTMAAMSNLVDSSSKSGSMLIDYEKGKTAYLIASHAMDNTKIDSYSLDVDILTTSVIKDGISLEVVVKSGINYNYLDEIYQNVEYHTLLLKETKGSWTILDDIYETEFLAAFPMGTEFNSLISSIEDDYTDYQLKVQESKNTSLLTAPVTRGAYDPFTSSERAAGASYALTYSENTGDYTTDSYNNSKFNSYGTNDCQNFVSQCIWYGMGGRSSSSKDYPMTTVWWANTSGETDTWNWTGTTYFKSWVQGSNNNNIDGVDYSHPTYIDECDYIYVPGHVMIVSEVDDQDGDGYADWDEIQICAHTKNRRDHNLKALYGGVSSPPSNMDFMKIYGKYN